MAKKGFEFISSAWSHQMLYGCRWCSGPRASFSASIPPDALLQSQEASPVSRDSRPPLGNHIPAFIPFPECIYSHFPWVGGLLQYTYFNSSSVRARCQLQPSSGIIRSSCEGRWLSWDDKRGGKIGEKWLWWVGMEGRSYTTNQWKQINEKRKRRERMER